MVEFLRKAFELAQQQPEAEQEVIAQLILEEFKGYSEKCVESPKVLTR